MLDPKERRARLRLHRETGNRWRLHKYLLAEFGSATAVYDAVAAGHPAVKLLPQPIVERLSRRNDNRLERQLDADEAWLAVPGRSLLVAGEPDYPARLAAIHDPPHLLFVHGDRTLLASNQLAMVGSRRMTAYGRRTAHRLARDLVRDGFTITSGLAIGVDTAAHEGALTAGGTTIAVLGSGCDVHYPPSNRRLAERVIEAGLIVSEFPLGTPARPHQFPVRNRVVTGLALGTLVIEATPRSGSLISARLALEQGREVFAVPGSVESPQSRGCHELIRSGACLVETVEDIYQELGYTAPATDNAAADRNAASSVLSGELKAILLHLGGESRLIDELAEVTGKSVADLLGLMTRLELEGLVERGPGGYRLAARLLESID